MAAAEKTSQPRRPQGGPPPLAGAGKPGAAESATVDTQALWPILRLSMRQRRVSGSPSANRPAGGGAAVEFSNPLAQELSKTRDC
ncbi:MAG: hypothetical protein A2W25_04080 [candidate division Zixibacteria bacterium RBG_16_53_22]|nr:MAG: hypothetical protein A2W25_04080 [candidate division Zixibacteria bacterium RBG_16_53_22]